MINAFGSLFPPRFVPISVNISTKDSLHRLMDATGGVKERWKGKKKVGDKRKIEKKKQTGRQRDKQRKGFRETDKHMFSYSWTDKRTDRKVRRKSET